ncbi:AP2-like ethylene-responsive transcription factor AIL6 [Linum perenne]
MAPAPAAVGSNWLSFSLSPMEMLRSSSSNSAESQYYSYDEASAAAAAAAAGAAPSPHYFLDNFYSHEGWGNPKESEAAGTTMTETALLTSFMDQQQHHQTQQPKLEDFLGDSAAAMVRYENGGEAAAAAADSSSLTQIYDNGAGGVAYFSDQQDLKAIAAFQGGFSTNSGASEVDDDSSIVIGGGHHHHHRGTEFITSQPIESELGYSSRNGLSLGVHNTDNNISNNENIQMSSSNSSEKALAVVAVESDCTKKLADTFGQRTSIYRGVTRHRWTGRYEAHLWDNSCRREGQARKGRQVCSGGYDKEDKAARAYDLAALKYWGPTATTNFPVSNYNKELEEMKYASKQEFIASLRRKSSGFSRGASIYRGVTRHHQQGRWQARIGRVAGNKDLYLGTFATEEEAAEAYDIAAIKFRGMNAVTNFEMNRYDVEAIMKSALPIGGAAKRLKISLDAEQKPTPTHNHQQQQEQQNSISFGSVQHQHQQQHQPIQSIPCGIPFDATALYHHTLYHHQHQTGNPPPPNTADSTTSNMVQTTDFFLWPHHQSY